MATFITKTVINQVVIAPTAKLLMNVEYSTQVSVEIRSLNFEELHILRNDPDYRDRMMDKVMDLENQKIKLWGFPVGEVRNEVNV